MTATSRLRRALRLVAKTLACSIAVLLLLVASVLLTINLPPVNGWLARRVTAALEPTFQGQLVLHRLGHLDFGGITGARVEVFDPERRSVLTASGIDVRVFWPGLVWQALVERPETLRVSFERIALEAVRVSVFDDGDGSPSLARAFQPKQPSSEEPSGGGTAIRVEAQGRQRGFACARRQRRFQGSGHAQA